MAEQNVKKYPKAVVDLAGQMRRDDYRTVKHMNKVDLTAYLTRVWRRGYEAGLKAAGETQKAADPEKSEE